MQQNHRKIRHGSKVFLELGGQNYADFISKPAIRFPPGQA
jgi:hypothetical protein